MSNTPRVQFETSLGSFVLELNEAKAPTTVANFLAYVDDGHFDGTIFHRVIKGFMIQGGGFTPDMNQKPTKDTIKNEANNGLSNDHYTVAMARTNDPHSATAQFFVNTKDNDFLNFTRESGSGWGYAVFGKVASGTEVIDTIEKVRTARSGYHDDVPVEAVVIAKASRLP
jgi:peptidyl-prolyl cis-trans isomerase B (cyclophilin B)